MNTDRFKNPWFWIGILGVIFSSMGVSPETLTSWTILKEQLIILISNPYMIVCVVMAVLGVFVDPTTKGIKDNK